MIRHTVLFKWTPESTAEQRLLASAEVDRLPSLISSVRAFACGPDAGLAEGNFDFGVSADFDDEAGYAAYRDAPAHLDVIARYIRPILAQRVAVQFRF